MKKNIIINFGMVICLMLILIGNDANSQEAWTAEQAFQVKSAGESYDERGFSKNNPIVLDGKLSVSNANGGVVYTYPISSLKINGYYLTTTMNYCSSVGMTAFAYYSTVAPKYWSSFSINRPAWILGVNGFAVQVLSLNGMYFLNPVMFGQLYYNKPNNFLDRKLNFVIDGYDYCNRMEELLEDHDQDVIKLLRSDGSILELRNPKRVIDRNDNDSSSVLYTGIYYENCANPRGYAVVEFQNEHEDANVDPYDDDNPSFKGRRVRYYPGDGYEYVFREWKIPYGLEPLFTNLGQVAGMQCTYGSYLSGPSIFYLESIYNQHRKITDFNYSRHYPEHPEGDPFNIVTDTTIGRGLLTDYYGHTIKYNYKSITIDALENSYDFRFDSLLVDGYNANDYTYMPFHRFGERWSADSYTKLSLNDDKNYFSMLGYITNIEGPNGRTTSFTYDTTRTNLTEQLFPAQRMNQYGNPDATRWSFGFKNLRLREIADPINKYQISYHTPVDTTLLGGDAFRNSVGLNKGLNQIVHTVDKYDRDNLLVTSDIYGFSFHNNSGAQANFSPFSYQTTLDHKTNKSIRKDIISGKVEIPPIKSTGSCQSPLVSTEVTEEITYSEDIRIRTVTEYDSVRGVSMYYRLPVKKTTYVRQNGDEIIKDITKFSYAYESFRDFNDAEINLKLGKILLRDTTKICDPRNESNIIKYVVSEYKNLPYSAGTPITIVDSVWDKFASIANFFYLRDEIKHPDIVGKSYEQVACKVAISRYDTLDQYIRRLPVMMSIPQKSFILDANKNILGGSSSIIEENEEENGQLTYARGKVVSDYIIGANGLQLLKGNYTYSPGDVTCGLPSSVENANGSKSSHYYHYSEIKEFQDVVELDYTDCKGMLYPTSKIINNQDEQDEMEFETDLYWETASKPVSDYFSVRRFAPDNNSLLQPGTLNHFTFTSWNNQSNPIQSMDPNGWGSRYYYDDLGRLTRMITPFDFSKRNFQYIQNTSDDSIRITSIGNTYENFEKYQVDCRSLIKDGDTTLKRITTFDGYGGGSSDRFYAGKYRNAYKPCPCGDPKPYTVIENITDLYGNDDALPPPQFGVKEGESSPSSDVYEPYAVKSGKNETALSTEEWIRNCGDPFIMFGNFTTATSKIYFYKPGEITTVASLSDVYLKLHISSITGNKVQLNVKSEILGYNKTFNFVFDLLTQMPGDNDREFVIDLNNYKDTVISLFNGSASSYIDFEFSVNTEGTSIEFNNNISVNPEDRNSLAPVIMLKGQFQKNVSTNDYTMAYAFHDCHRDESPDIGISYKLDDMLHTSNSLLEYDMNKFGRYVYYTNHLGADYIVKTKDRGTSMNTDVYSQTHTDFSGLGQPLTVTDPLGFQTNTVYNAAGEPVTVKFPDSDQNPDNNPSVNYNYKVGTESTFGITDQDFYGFCKAKTSISSENKRVTEYTDAFDRLRRVVADSGGVNYITKYEYDILDRPKFIFTPNGDTIRYWYDAFGKTKYKYQQELGYLSYAYDNVGNVRLSQNSEQAANSRVSFFEYDDLNRMTLMGEAKIDREVPPMVHNLLEDNLNLSRLTDVLNPAILNDGGLSGILTANKTLLMQPQVPQPWQDLNLTSITLTNNIPAHYRTANSLLGTEVKPNPPLLMHPAYMYEKPAWIPAAASDFEDISKYPHHAVLAMQYDTLPFRMGAVWGKMPDINNWKQLCPHGDIRNMKGKNVAVAYREHGGQPFNYMIFSYDARGRVEAMIRFTQNLGFDAVYYQYNSMNLVTAVRVADPWRQYITWYGYDNYGRIDTVWSHFVQDRGLFGQQSQWSMSTPAYPPMPARPEAAEITYTYNKRDQITQMKYPPVNVLVQYAYNPRMWLDTLIATRNGADIFRQFLQYDRDGLIMAQKSGHEADPLLEQVYNYDNLSRLTDWTVPNTNRSQHFAYDGAGNRLMEINDGRPIEYSYRMTPASPKTNKLLKLNSQGRGRDYTYNLNGSLEKRELLTNNRGLWFNSVEKMEYDVRGLLEKYSVSNRISLDSCFFPAHDTTRTEWRYVYNPMNEREQKRMYYSPSRDSAGGVYPWTYYLLGSGNRQLAVYHGIQAADPQLRSAQGTLFANPVRNVYFYPAEFNTYAGSGANLTYRVDINGSWRKEYKIFDHLGDIRSVVNDMGVTEGKYDYEPFGKKMTVLNNKNRLTFIGKENDFESQFGDFGVRKYDDETGRFTSVDPLWEKYYPWSPYHYSLDNPIIFIDNGGFNASLITSGPTSHSEGSGVDLWLFTWPVESGINGLAGHSAIRVDDNVYSFEGDGKWHVYKYGEYMDHETKIRTVIEQPLVNVDQDKIKAFIEPKINVSTKYDVYTNSCVTNTMQALSQGGIPVTPLKKLDGAPSPEQLSNDLQKSGNVQKTKAKKEVSLSTKSFFGIAVNRLFSSLFKNPSGIKMNTKPLVKKTNNTKKKEDS